MDFMIKVLFLCTGNSCRSQMAEGFLKEYQNFNVHSAGTDPGEMVQPLTVVVMNELDIDLSLQRPKSVNEFVKDEFDYLITVCNDAKETCPVFIGKVKHRLHIGFEDPHGKSIDVFRRVRDEIKKEIDKFALLVNRDFIK